MGGIKADELINFDQSSQTKSVTSCDESPYERLIKPFRYLKSEDTLP